MNTDNQNLYVKQLQLVSSCISLLRKYTQFI